MKTHNIKLAVKIVLLFQFSSFIACCNDDQELIEDSNPLKLEASSDSTTLDNGDLDKEILSFTWEMAPDYPLEGTSFEGFLFKFDVGDNDFETSIPTSAIKDGVYYKTFTTRELNKLIQDWGIKPGDVITLDARVIAKLSNSNKYIKPFVSTIQVKIKSCEMNSVPIFLCGSSIPAGADPSNASTLKEVSLGEFYSWRGKLVAGEYILPLSSDALYPAYAKGADANDLVLKKSASEPGDPFVVTEDGYYCITLNKSSMKINCEKVWDDTTYPLYLFGNSVGGWTNTDASQKMVWDDKNPHICSITATISNLSNGSFRISTMINGNNNFGFRPYIKSPITTTPQAVLLRSSPDTNWASTSNDAGKYIINLDTKNMTIKFNKL